MLLAMECNDEVAGVGCSFLLSSLSAGVGSYQTALLWHRPGIWASALRRLETGRSQTAFAWKISSLLGAHNDLLFFFSLIPVWPVSPFYVPFLIVLVNSPLSLPQLAAPVDSACVAVLAQL